MPIKVCPKCGAKHGCRRLVCDCGHDFGSKRKTKPADVTHAFPYPEPGTWVWDKAKGMPPIDAPGELPPGPLSVQVVKEQVSYEGLGFCIHTFIEPARISDPQLQELWVKARTAMQEIVTYLDQVTWKET